MIRDVAATGRATPFWFLFAGLIVWAVRFLAVYLLTEAVCARGEEGASLLGLGVLPAFIVVSAIVGIAINVWLIVVGTVRTRNADSDSREHFIAFVGATVAVMSIVAITWETLPTFLLPVCQ